MRTFAAKERDWAPPNSTSISAALGSCPAANICANASSTPLSLRRAARCKIRTYSRFARAGSCSNSSS